MSITIFRNVSFRVKPSLYNKLNTEIIEELYVIG